MKRWSLPRTYFTRMLLSFTLVLVFIISTVSTAIYVYVEKVVTQTVENMSQKTLSQISYSANYMHDSARNTAYTLFNDAKVIQYMYQEQIDYSDMVQGVSQLRTWSDTNSFIYSIYVYNEKLNVYLSTVGMDVAMPSDQFFDTGIRELMKQRALESRSLMPIPRSTKLSINGVIQENVVDVFTYIIYDLQSVDNEIQGAVVLNIKAEYLQNIIKSLLSKKKTDQGRLIIVDEKGEIVIGSDDQAKGASLAENGFIDKVLQSDSESGNFKAQVEGQDMRITYAKSDQLGWRFIELVPYQQIYAPLYKIKWMTMLVCSIMLILGILSAFLVSRQVSSPIRQLVGRVTHLTKSGEQARDRGELVFLSESFAETFHQNKYLDLEVKRHRKSEMLRNYLMYNGQPSLNSVSLSFLDYEVKLTTDEIYAMILLRIDHYSELIQTYSRGDQSLLRYGIHNTAVEIMASYEKLEVVDMEGEYLVILLNPTEASEEHYIDRVASLLKQLQSWSAQNLKLSITAAIGGYRDHITEINEEFLELQELIKYRFVYGYQSLINKSMLPNCNSQFEASTQALEDKIIAELAGGNLNLAIQSYDELILMLKQMTYNQIISALIHFIYVLNNRIMTLQNNSPAKFDVDFQYFTREIINAETLDEVKNRFVLLFKQIDLGIELKSTGRGQLVINSVIQIIENRYMDPNLSLNVIAEEIKLSRVYLGKIFRDATGQSVADYINEVRIQQVIKQLEHSDSPLTEIMDKVGIENKSYFYTKFKNRMGVSVSDYRKRHLGQK